MSTIQQPGPPLAGVGAPSPRTRVTVAGGGRIGSAVAALLGPTGDYDLTIVDRVPPRTSASTSTRTVLADVSDPTALRHALASSQIVVNALPFHLTTTCLDAALTVGADYVDLTEDVAASRNVRARAEDSGLTVVPQCGLAPGFVSIAANGLAAGFDQVRDLALRVGALPRSPRNGLGYNLTWSTEGVINEYIEPCQAIAGGRLVEVPALEGLETVGVDGVRYEAFNTSGGLGTLAETWLGRCERLDYKSLRHPGHAEIMRVLLHDLRLADHRDELHAILERALPDTGDDVVVISVSVTGWRDGRLTEDQLVRTIGAQHVLVGPGDALDLSAIQATTAASACAIVDLVAGGHLPHPGVVRQEEIPLDTFLTNRFGQLYDTGMLLAPMAAAS